MLMPPHWVSAMCCSSAQPAKLGAGTRAPGPAHGDGGQHAALPDTRAGPLVSPCGWVADGLWFPPLHTLRWASCPQRNETNPQPGASSKGGFSAQRVPPATTRPARPHQAPPGCTEPHQAPLSPTRTPHSPQGPQAPPGPTQPHQAPGCPGPQAPRCPRQAD